MAATRLRKTFQYQDEGSDVDDEPPMDEQEQEELIARLTKENDQKNDYYLQFILILPFISCVTFIIGIFRDSIPTARLACMLSISSLIASAYNLRGIPIQAPGPSRPATLGRISTTDSLSPAQKYIPMLNAALSMLLALWGFSFRSRGGVVEGFWMMCWLPLINFGMIQMTRKWAVDVDPSELEKLKYDFRGA